MIRIEERHIGAGDIFQFEELVTFCIRVIHDFIDDDRPNARTGINRSQRQGELCWKLLFPRAGQVAPEWHADGRRSETREPLWMIVRVGRQKRYAAVPLDQAMEGGGRVWVPYERERIRSPSRVG